MDCTCSSCDTNNKNFFGVAASDQRVVSISGREEAQAPSSPAVQALMYCAAPVLQEEGDPQKILRLVVPSSQVRQTTNESILLMQKCIDLVRMLCLIQSYICQ